MSTKLLPAKSRIQRQAYGFLLCLLLVAAQASAQTITTGTISGSPFCAGATLSVSFISSVSGSKTYTAQLSSASGSFSSPVTIGTASSNGSGTIPGAVIPAATATGSGYRIRVVQGTTLGTDNGANLTINALSPVAPITGTATACLGGTTTLSSSTAGGGWSSSNTAIATVTSAGVVTGVAAGSATISYTVTNGAGCANSATQAVTITALPGAPTVSSPVTYCPNASASALTATGTNLKWYAAATGGTGSATAPTPSTATLGTSSYYVSQTNANGCEGPRAQIDVVISQPTSGTLTKGAAVTGATVCAGTAVSATATAGSGGAGTTADVVQSRFDGGAWTAYTSGSPLATTGHTSVEIQTYRTATGSGCTQSAPTLVSWTINPLPTAVLSGTATICAGSSTTLSVALTGTAPWSLTYSDGTTPVTLTNITSSPALLSVSPVSTKTYTVTAVADANCTGTSRTGSAVITVSPKPGLVVGANPVACSGVTSVNLPYSGATNTPTQYSIIYDANANNEGFANVVNAALPVSPIVLPVVTQTAGTYTGLLTVTNAAGCVSASYPIVVTLNAAPTVAAITGTPTVCAGSTTQLSNATPGGTWSSTSTASASVDQNGLVSGLVAGGTTINYTVTAGGCSTTSSVAVTVNPLPTLSSPTTAATCSSSPFAYTATSATSGTSFSWTRAVVAGISNAASAGSSASLSETLLNTTTTPVAVTYVFTLTAANGCSRNQNVVVTVNPTPATPTLSLTQPTCTTSTGSITVTAPTPTGSYTYSLNGGAYQSSTTFSGLAAGSAYSLTAKSNSTGCVSLAATGSLQAQPVTPAAPGVAAVAYCRNAPASPLSATGTGLLWYPSATGGTGSATAPTPATNTVGTSSYYVSQTSNGCESPRAKLDVTINPLPTAVLSGTATICAGSSTTLSVALTGTAPWSLTYSDGTTPVTLTNITSSPALLSVSPVSTKTYSVTSITDANCTGTSSGSRLVTVNPLPALSSPTAAAVCSSSPFAYTATSATSGTSFSWTRAVVAGISNAASAGSSASLSETLLNTTTAPVAVTYVFTLTAAGCSQSQNVVVTVNPTPTVAAITGATSACVGESIALTNATNGGQWGTSNAGVATVNPATGVVTGVSAGTATISYTVADGTCSATVTRLVTINALPATPTISGQTAFCAGSSVTLTSSAAAGNQWNKDGVALSGETGQTFVAALPGSYTVTVTNASNCAATSAATTLTEVPLPVLVVTSPAAACAPATIDLTAAAVTAGSTLPPGTILSYWTDAAATIALNAPNAVAASGTYYIKASSNGCVATKGVGVTITPTPSAPTVAAASLTYCQNEPAEALSATASAGGTLYWYSTAAGGLGDANAPTPATASAGITDYYVSQLVNGCESPRTPIRVTVNPTPAAPGVAAVAYCRNAAASPLSATGTGLLWYPSATGGTGSATAPTPATNTVGTSSYYVSQTSNGCESPRAKLDVTINPLPSLTVAADGPTTFCEGASVTLTASGGTSYVWSNGATTDAITVSTSGSYSVEARNAEGCAVTSTPTTVTVNPVPSAAFTYPGATFCTSGSNPTPTITGASGGTFAASSQELVLNSTTGTLNLAASQAGTYTVTYTVDGTCPNAATASVTITTAPVATFAYGAATYCSSDAAASATLAAGATAGTFSATPAGLTLDASTGEITPSSSAAGTYTVTNALAAADGCAATSASTAVTINAAPVIAAGGQPQSATATVGQPASFAVTATGTSIAYQWYKGTPGTGHAIDGATSSTYTIPRVDVGNAGDYYVAVSGTCAPVATSSAATLTVEKAAATLTLADLAPTYDGTPKEALATTDPAGLTTINFTYAGSATAPTNAGSYAVVATLDNPSYAGTASGTLAIGKATPTVTALGGSFSYDGFAKSGSGTATGVEATPAVLAPVALSYSGTGTTTYGPDAPAAPTGAGTYTVTATFAGNGNYVSATSSPVALTIVKAHQTITFAALGGQTYDAPDFALTASASSMLPVTFTVSGPATLVGDHTLHITGVGLVTVTAAQAGDPNYEAATAVTRTFLVDKATAAVAFDEASLSQLYDGTPKAAAATTTAPGLSSFTFTYDGSATAPTSVGSYIVVATLVNANYSGAASATLTIGNATPTVAAVGGTFEYDGTARPGSGTATGAGSPAVALTPVALSYEQTTDNGASYQALAAAPVNAGHYRVVAYYAGDANYRSGSATASLTITPATPTANLVVASRFTYDGQPHGATTASLTGVGGAAVGATVAYAGVGATAYAAGTPPTNAGSYTVTVASDGSDANYRPASATQAFVIDKAPATLAFGTSVFSYDGSAKPVSVTTTPAGLGVVTTTYAGLPAAPSTVGEYALEATLTNDNYSAATLAGTLKITQATPLLTWVPAPLAGIAYGTSLAGKLNATASLNGMAVAGTFAYKQGTTSVTEATLLDAQNGPYALSVDFTPADAANYSAATTTNTITVGPAAQTISFTNPGPKTFGDDSFALVASASSGLPVSFDLVSGPATVAGSLVTITGAGTITVRASQSGSGNYTAAAAVEQSFTVSRAPATIAFAAADLTQQYSGTAKTVGATVLPAAAGVQVAYSQGGLGIAAPLSAGTYQVVATLTNPDYQLVDEAGHSLARREATFVIEKLGPVFASLTASQSIAYGSGSIALAGRLSAGSLIPTGTVTVSINGTASAPAPLEADGSFSLAYSTATLPARPTAYDITYTYGGDLNFGEAQDASTSLTVTQVQPTVAWTAPAAIGYGTALSATQLNATADVAGTFSYTPATGTVLDAGSQLLSVSFVPADATNYTIPADKTVAITVTKAEAKVAVTGFSGAYDGLAHGATGTATGIQGTDLSSQLNLGDAFTAVPGGTANWRFSGGTNYNDQSGSVEIALSKALASVNLTDLTQTYDGSPRVAAATTTATGPSHFAFTYDGSATAPTNVGSYTVEATLINDNFSGSATGTLVIGQADASALITLAGLTNTYDATPKAATASTTISGPSSFTVTYDGSATIPTDYKAGGYAVVATLSNPNYSGSATGTLTIGQAALTVTTTSRTKIYGEALTAADFTGFLSGNVAADQLSLGNFASSGAGATAGAGAAYPITATVADPANRLRNYQVTNAFGNLSVDKAVLSILLGTSEFTYDGGAKVVSATTQPTGVAGVSVTYDGLSAAPTNAGSYALAATLSNPNYSAPEVTGTLVIRPAQPVVAWAPLTAITYGTSLAGKLTAAATANGAAVAGTYAYQQGLTPVTDQTVLGAQAAPYALSVAFTPADATNYTAASTTNSLTVGPAALTVTNTSRTKAFGQELTAADFAGTLTGVVNNDPITVSRGSEGAAAAAAVGTYSIVGTLNDPDQKLANYTVSNQSGVLTVTTTSQLISFTDPGLQTYGNPVVSLTAAATSGLPVAFRVVSGPATLVGNQLSLTGAGIVVVRASQAGNANYTAAPDVDVTVSVQAKELTAGITADNKVYDGTTAATISTRMLSGKVGLDEVSLSGGTARFADKLVGTGKTVTATGFTLTGAQAANYRLASAAVTAPATITAVVLTPHILAASKAYDGTAAATITARTLTGVLPGDDVTLTGGVASFADASVAPDKPVTATGLSLTGADAGNYSLSATTAATTASITKQALIVTATPGQSKTYGAPTPVLTYAVSSGVLAPGDAFTGALSRAAGEQVGNYAISLGTLALSSNYTLSLTSGSTFAITAKALTASFTAAGKVYNGTTAATILTRTLTGVVGTDAVTLSGGTATFDTKAAGTNKTVTATGFSLGGTASGNYTFASAPVTTMATITAKALPVTVTAASKVYDGTVAATATGSFSGLIAGDVVQLSVGSAAFADKNVGANKPVTISGLGLTGPDAGNYSLASTTATAPASITAKALAVTLLASDKPYDGTTTATVSVLVGAGLISGDAVTVTAANAGFSSSTVGTGKTVTASLVLSGADAGNYSASAKASATASITAKAVTAALVANSKVYDGTTAATIASSSLTGLISGDKVQVVTGAATFADANVGSGKAVTATGLSLTGGDAGNYSLTATTAATTASITPAALKVTAANASRSYGSPDPVFTGTYTGAKNGETFTVGGSTSATAASPIGSYSLVPSISGATLANYTVTAVNATLTITPATLTAAVASASRQYSDPNPVFTGTYSGAKNGETFTVGATTSATAASAPGSYALTTTVSGATLSNYTVSKTNGTLTVTQEDARATYTGPTVVTITATKQSTSKATVSLSASVLDITAVPGDPSYDAAAGNITNATVSFINRATNAIIATVPVTLINSADPTKGTATFNWTVDIGTAGSVSYTIGTRVNNYYTGTGADAVVKVAKPGAALTTPELPTPAVAAKAAPVSTLLEIYPNPMADQATIHFHTKDGGKAQLYLYNAVGNLVSTLFNAEVASGRDYTLTLTREDLPNGVYFCRLISNGKVENKRITIER